MCLTAKSHLSLEDGPMGFQKSPVRVWVGTLVLALSFAVSAAANSTAKLASIKIDNFEQVSDSYYRGGHLVGHDYADLAALGVKTVIDLTGDDEADVNEPALVQKAGMKAVHIPMTTHDQPSQETIAKFLKLVNDPANQPVYVHCVGGHHRTGVMTAVYRMNQDGWNADRAYAEMQQYGFGPAFLHSTLKDFVFSYHPAAAATAIAATATQTSRQ